MAECIERAVAVKVVLRERKPTNSVAQNRMLSIIQRDLLTMRAADVAPVVRCKDCAHLYGTLCTVCGLLPRKPDDFCSRGERKDGTDSDTDGSI